MSIFIAECGDYESNTITPVIDAMLEATGLPERIKPGMRVGIKLNLCAAAEPERAATTHPELAAALAEILARAGADVILGDSPGGPFTARHLGHIYRVTGLEEAVRAGNERIENETRTAAPNSGTMHYGRILLNDDFEDVETTFKDGVSIKSFRYCRWLTNCELIINFAKLKSHGLMGITGAAKNLYGVIPGTVKSEYHFLHTDPMDFANMLVDLDEYVKPVLHIVDAVDIMEGNGPTAGTRRHMGLILAGESPYELDRAGARLLKVSENEIPYLIAAKQRGLLEESAQIIPEKPEDQDLLDRYSIGDFVRSGATASWFARTPDDRGLKKLAKQGLYVLMRSKPSVKEGCIGCGQCAKGCPADAITIRNSAAVINRSKCIRCFCCQEFCPTGAMKVQRSPVARLLRK